MKYILSKRIIALSVIFLLLLADQILKVWVKTNMYLYENIEVFSWFKIYFVENNGMAFGVEVIGKLFLSIFRIVAVGFIGYYLWKIIKENYKIGYIICISLVLAGAVGNILDSVFYGVVFSESTPFQMAQIVPLGEGYSSWLHGKVVDMFYCPIIETTYPDWFPFNAGNKFVFFSPVFNLADSAISVGIVLLLLFYRKTLSSSLQSNDESIKE